MSKNKKTKKSEGLTSSLGMKEIFINSQKNVTSHDFLISQMKKLYRKSKMEDFLEQFMRYLGCFFVVEEKQPAVDRGLDFAVKFAVSVGVPQRKNNAPEAYEEDEMHPFLLQLFESVFARHQCVYASVRFRVCQFVSKLLNALGEDTCIDDALCTRICECMLERLQDKIPTVRAQAVMALQRLQDPSDPDCQVMKAFIFHLNHDPNFAVRRAVLSCVGRTNITLPHIIDRIHDPSDSVRRHAYYIVSKLNIKALTIKQRKLLLSQGLRDRSECVKRVVSNTLLSSWLLNLKGNYMELLRAINAENSTETAIMVLNILFEKQPLRVLLANLPINEEERIIPLENLTPENALYWRCLAHFLHKDEREYLAEELEKIVPELTQFCQYIRRYFLEKNEDGQDSWAQIQQQFIVLQLLELAKIFDLADEVGRLNLKNLIFDLLLSTRVKEPLVPILIQLIGNVIPDVNSRFQNLAEIISEIHEPMNQVVVQVSEEDLRKLHIQQAKIRVELNEIQEERELAVEASDYILAQTLKEKETALIQKLNELMAEPEVVTQEVREECNDRVTVSKCLSIIFEMMQPVTQLTPHLRSLMENFVLNFIQDPDAYIRALVIKVMAVFCILDIEMAKKHIFFFFFQVVNTETEELGVISLKAIFDIFLRHGLQPFQLEDDDTEKEADKTGKKKLFDATDTALDSDEDEENTQTNKMAGNSNNFIAVLTSTLDDKSLSIRTAAAEGLCKLLMCKRIKSPNLVSRLFLMCFSPVTEEEQLLRQMLTHFFLLFASKCSWSQEMLEQAFLLTIRTVFQAPPTSPLTEIDQEMVIKIMLNLTRPGINQTESQVHVHNNLAFALCNEVLNESDTYSIQILLRGLTLLELNLEDPVTTKNLTVLADQVAKFVTDKVSLRLIQKFQQKLANENLSRKRESTNTASDVQSTNINATSVSNMDTTGAEKTVDTDPADHMSIEDDSDCSPERNTWPPLPDNVQVIPESPDVSDSTLSQRTSSQSICPSPTPLRRSTRLSKRKHKK